MENIKKKLVLKTLLVFGAYLVYTTLIVSLLNMLGFNNDMASVFIADLVFFIFIVYLYKDNLKDGFNKYIKEVKLSKKITIIVVWVVIIFVMNIIMGAITELFYPGLSTDENTKTIISLFDISFLYTIFKTLIFATVAEELVFKKAIRDVVDNNILFVVISSIIYTVMNFIYADLSISMIWMYFLIYLVPSLLLSFAYVKNNNNIFVVIVIKFMYNLIPLTLLISGV